VNIFRTFGVCLVVCLLSLAGCSDNSNDKSSRPSREPHFQLSQSPKTELERMVQRADAGDPVAQNNLGAAYSDGEGVPEDDVEAVKWFRLAAEQGEAMAQNNLGKHLDDGLGVPEDDIEAVKWYRLAAEQGNATGQNNLGVAYSDGEGVPEDDVEAYAWLSIAAVGDVDHEKNRDIVKESLSDSQLALGQRRATELFEKYGSGK